VISPNVNYRQWKSHVMNYARSVGERIYAMEQSDAERPADDPLLSLYWRRSIDCCIECYSFEELLISSDLEGKQVVVCEVSRKINEIILGLVMKGNEVAVVDRDIGTG
jgi:hypothetical protein